MSHPPFARYSSFMLLPQGLIRGLATKKLDLDDEEDDDTDVEQIMKTEVATQQANEAGRSSAQDGKGEDSSKRGSTGGAAAFVQGTTSFIKLDFSTQAKEDAGKDGGRAWAALKWVATLFRAKAAAAVHGKRQLIPSMEAVLWMTAPFVAWGILIVACNSVANIQVSSISAPTALFNMVGAWVGGVLWGCILVILVILA